MSDVKLNTKALDNFIKAMKTSGGPRVSVGIMGGGSRSDGTTNATVGAAHEFGTSTLPKRSFLREPLIEGLDAKLFSSGKFDEAELKKVIREHGIKAWLNRIAICSEQVVMEAFDTAFGGKWKKSDMSRKKVHQTLVESQQLRNSITTEIRE